MRYFVEKIATGNIWPEKFMIKILRALKATVKLKETRRRKLSHRVHSSSTRAMYVLITPTNLA